MIERKTISIMKACELVGVSRRTIYNWIASGKVEYVRTAGGSVRIFVDTLWREPGKVAELTRKEASYVPPTDASTPCTSPDLGLLFHRLNNQLGIILANAELLEAKAADEMDARARLAGGRQRARRDGHRQGNPLANPSIDDSTAGSLTPTDVKSVKKLTRAGSSDGRNFPPLHIRNTHKY